VSFSFLSSHYHLLLWVRDARQLALFMGYFNGNLAREMGHLTGWTDRIWARRYQAILTAGCRRLSRSGGKAPERRPERGLSARQLPTPFTVRPGLSPVRNHGLNRGSDRTGDSTGRWSRCASRGGYSGTWPT
jgi:hypothetical protein